MKTIRVGLLVLFAAATQAAPSFAQLGLFTTEQRIQFTPDWKGERFPDGRLVEEREALRVQALAQLGRAAEAHEVAARFRRQYPRSMLLPVVDAALQSLP